MVKLRDFFVEEEAAIIENIHNVYDVDLNYQENEHLSHEEAREIVKQIQITNHRLLDCAILDPYGDIFDDYESFAKEKWTLLSLNEVLIHNLDIVVNSLRAMKKLQSLDNGKNIEENKVNPINSTVETPQMLTNVGVVKYNKHFIIAEQNRLMSVLKDNFTKIGKELRQYLAGYTY